MYKYPPTVHTNQVTDPVSFKTTLRIIAEPSGNIFSDEKSIFIAKQPYSNHPEDFSIQFTERWTSPRPYIP